MYPTKVEVITTGPGGNLAQSDAIHEDMLTHPVPHIDDVMARSGHRVGGLSWGSQSPFWRYL